MHFYKYRVVGLEQSLDKPQWGQHSQNTNKKKQTKKQTTPEAKHTKEEERPGKIEELSRMRQRGGTHAALRHREWWRGAPRVVQRPTQKGKAKKRNRQAQHGVEGSAPHRYSKITKGNRVYSISRPAGNSTRKQEAVPTGETLGPLR